MSRRWIIALGIGLALSVCLNLFLAGLWAGRMHGPRLLPPLTVGPPDFEPPLALLPPDERGPIRHALRAARPELAVRHRAVFEARRALAQSLAATPFDRPLYEQRAAELRKRIDELQEALHRSFGDMIEHLPPDVRSRQAQRIFEGNFSAR